MIAQIGEWVIRTACEQSKAWEKAGLTSILMTANVSSLQFNQDIFTERIALILKETGLNPFYLQFLGQRRMERWVYLRRLRGGR